MYLKKLLKYGLMAIYLYGNSISIAMAMDDKKSEEKILIVGCRPWDKGLQEIENLKEAHFIDFMATGSPNPPPANFHHLDINDTGGNSAGKFSDFAAENSGIYTTIIIDWMTCHHIRRNTAWSDFASILKPVGRFIVPVTHIENFILASQKKAEEIKDRHLKTIFNNIEIRSYEDMSAEISLDLLRRPGITEAALSMNPAIMLATGPLTLKAQGEAQNIDITREVAFTPAFNVPALFQRPLDGTVINNPAEKGWSEIKLPDISTIKERLFLGQSTIVSETNHEFKVRCLLGQFNGFNPEITKETLNIKMKFIRITDDKKLLGILEIIFNEKPHIPLYTTYLISQDSYPFYKLQGGIEKRSPNHKSLFSNLEKIMVQNEMANKAL